MPCGPGAVKWIENAFGDCLEAPRDYVSFVFGMISNVLWAVSSFPQIYSTCKAKTVERQNPFFFSFLTLGNVMNLVGIIITKGLFTQLITAILYLFFDGIMFSQYLYYRYIKKCICGVDGEDGNVESEEKEKEEQVEQGINENDDSCSAHLPAAMLVGTAAAKKMDWKAPYSGNQLVGSIFGWIGGCIYVTSRIPQCIQQNKTKKIALSPYYIVMVIFANLTYLLSVIIKSTEKNYIWKQLPFIFGATPMLFDITSFIQLFLFRKYNNDNNDSIKKSDSKYDLESDSNSEGKNIAEF